MLGGVFSGWVSRVERQGVAVLAAVIVWGLAMFGFGLAVGARRHVATGRCSSVAVLMLVIGGAADMASAAFRTSMLQSAASDDVRGRLQGVFTVVVVGGPRIADVAHGAVAVSIGAAATAAGGGLLVVVGTVLAAVAFPAFIRYRVVAATRSGLSQPRLTPRAARARSRTPPRPPAPGRAGRAWPSRLDTWVFTVVSPR